MSDALATLQAATDTARRNGDHFWLPRLPNCIAWVYRELGDYGRALEHDQQGVEIARQDHVLEAEANSLINLGIDYTCAREGDKTIAAFHQVEDIFNRDAWFRWRYNIRHQAARAEHCLAQGDLNEATRYARRLLEVATQYQARKYAAVAHRLLADVAVARGARSEADTELNTALDLLRSYPIPVVAWKIYAALGRVRLHSGHHPAAREAFSHAAAIVNQIAANVRDENLRAMFLSSPAAQEVLDGSNERLHTG